MNAIATVLEQAGFGTFLPHRDGLERFITGIVNTPLNNNLLGARDAVNKAIFALDCYQIIKRCDCLVLNMNGRVPDEGAVAEAGIAFSVGKPVVLYKNDRRGVFKGADNSMITGLSPIKPIRVIRRLPEAVIRLESRLRSADRLRLPEHVEQIARTGERIWHALEFLPGASVPGEEILGMIENILDICEQPPGPH